MKGRPLTNRKKRIAPWITVATILLVLATPTVWVLLQFADFPLVAPRLDESVKKYRVAGLPWVASELVQPVPAEQNAAIEVKEAIGLAGENLFSANEKSVTDAWKSGDKAAVKKSLKELDPIIDRYMAASRKPKFNYDREWHLGPTLLFPEYAELKSVAKALVKRAILSAESGNLAASGRDLEAASRLGNLVAQEPNLIAMLVGIAMNMIALDGVVRIAEVRSDPQTLRELQKIVGRLENKSNFELAVRGEAFFGVTICRNLHPAAFRSLAGMDEDPKISFRREDGLPNGIIMRAILVRHLDLHLQFKEILDKYPHDSFAASRELDMAAIKATVGTSYSRSMSTIFNPVYEQAGTAVGNSVSRKQMTVLLLKSLEYKNKHGKFPTNLKVHGLPLLDNVTGKELLSSIVDGVYSVYSVGRNGVDEQGMKGEGSGADDVAVRFPPKPW